MGSVVLDLRPAIWETIAAAGSDCTSRVSEERVASWRCREDSDNRGFAGGFGRGEGEFGGGGGAFFSDVSHTN